MTLNDLLDELDNLPDTAPLVFESGTGSINGGYHVTELKLATVTSIDCGARVAEWTEASLQLLDGNGGEFMPVAKFKSILAQSVRHVPGLGDCPVHVEFAPGNIGMRIWQPSAPENQNGQVTIKLSDSRAHCKPALEAFASVSTTSCCPTRGSASSCCG